MTNSSTTKNKSQLFLTFPYLRNDGQLIFSNFQPGEDLKKKLLEIHVDDQEASYIFSFPRIQEKYEFIKPCMDLLQNILLPLSRVKYTETEEKNFWKYYLNNKLIPQLKKFSLEQIYCFEGILYNLGLIKLYTALYNSAKQVHTSLTTDGIKLKDVKYKLVIYKSGA